MKELQDFGFEVYVHDLVAEFDKAQYEYSITLSEWGRLTHNADAIAIAYTTP